MVYATFIRKILLGFAARCVRWHTTNRHLAIYLLMICFINQGYCLDSNIWRCRIQDAENISWSAENSYKRLAVNIAMESCKKESKIPASCNISRVICEGSGYILNRTSRSYETGWRCTAIDYIARAWKSRFSANVDAAALNALSFCRKSSRVPETCYVNFVTCGQNMGL